MPGKKQKGEGLNAQRTLTKNDALTLQTALFTCGEITGTFRSAPTVLVWRNLPKICS